MFCIWWLWWYQLCKASACWSCYHDMLPIEMHTSMKDNAPVDCIWIDALCITICCISWWAVCACSVDLLSWHESNEKFWEMYVSYAQRVAVPVWSLMTPQVSRSGGAQRSRARRMLPRHGHPDCVLCLVAVQVADAETNLLCVCVNNY